jgi:DNA-binding NarL/FixJ family response regulator
MPPFGDGGVDFTPLLAQLQANSVLTGNLLRDARVVICLGSRAQISFLVCSRINDGKIVGAATTEAEGLALVKRLQPDFLFTSDELEQGSGVDLVVAVKALPEPPRTLLMVREERQRTGIRRAFEAGCDGILLEEGMGLGHGLEAIRAVSGGGIYLDRALGPTLLSALESQGEGPPPPSLSQREHDVLERLVRGESNADIAANLTIAVDTVKTHLRNLLLKLHARDRTQAAVRGLQLGLVDWPEPLEDR